jgi:cysteine-rich repeat protein
LCGDGIILQGIEVCDKFIQTVGCDAACNQEKGFSCTNYNESYGVCDRMFVRIFNIKF